MLRLLGLLACVLPAALAAQAPDTLTGRVTGTGGAPIAGAQVYVTRGPDRLVLRDTTDADGRWRLVFAPGTGDYLVFIASPPSPPFRKRVMRAANERSFVVDATLATPVVAGAPGAGGAPGAPGAAGAAGQGPGVQQLAGVRVTAQVPRPSRTERNSVAPSTGGNERIADGVTDAVAPGDQGNALATASTVPGVVIGSGGAAVLGASPDQSLVTLNGLANGGVLPREASTRTRVASAAYDPSVGGFSGALVAVELQPGGEYTTRRGSLTVDGPVLRSTTSLAEAYGLVPAALQASYGQEGMLREDRLFYTTAMQASRRSASQASLASADASVLARNGLAPADASAIAGALGRAGVPVGAAAPDRIADALSFLGQFDLAPTSNHARRLTAQLNLAQSSGLALSPTALPSVAGDARDLSGALQFGSQAYVGRQKNRLNDFRASLSWARATRTPGTTLPGGVVRVPDLVQAGDPAAAVPSIPFGGLAAIEGTRDQWTAEVGDDFTFDKGQRHRVRVHAWSRVDGVRDATLADARGTFAYNTLADFEAGRAAAFTRTLAQPERGGTAWNGAAALSHRWAPSRVFQLLYGARVEGNAFLGAPAANPALAQSLDLRTDVSPRALHVSPRAGFTWYLVRRNAGRSGTRGYGYASTIELPVGLLRGGVGEFRGIYRPGTIADADGATGRPEDVRRLACFGAAVPVADWDGYVTPGATFPGTCANGQGGLADAAPPVVALSPDYRPARSWRASLGWNSRVEGWFDYRIDATYALNLDQPSSLDRNFAGTSVFALGAEGGRPVFVPVGAIDPLGGGVSPIASRRSADFGTVAERRSDLRGHARQVTVSVLPSLPGRIGRRTFTSLAYTYANARSAARGFDGGTADDPRVVDWARTPFDVRHQVIAQLGTQLPLGISLQLFARVQSGLPFTPIVAGDVNGDGRGGDRAYLFADGAQGADLSPLLATASGRVRRCLARQLGAIAGRNSCEGPWTQSMSLRLTVPGRRIGISNRLDFGLQFANPLGAIDRLVNGRDAKGWGTDWTPDPVLLVPRGFDVAQRRFRYDVNPQFGETRPARVTRPIDPWGITLDARVDFSTPRAVQQLRRQLAPGRDGDPRPRLTAPQLQERYVRSVGNLWVPVMQLSDTLLLTPGQVDSLRTLELAWRGQLDSLFGPLSAYLAELPASYDGVAALAKVRAARADAWRLTHGWVPRMKAILTPVQFGILPPFIRDIMGREPAELTRDFWSWQFTPTPGGMNMSIDVGTPP
jgi:hypothetical protein